MSGGSYVDGMANSSRGIKRKCNEAFEEIDGEFSYVWELENFSTHQSEQISVFSPSFCGGEHKWFLEIDFGPFWFIYLHKASGKRENWELKRKIKITILDRDFQPMSATQKDNSLKIRCDAWKKTEKGSKEASSSKESRILEEKGQLLMVFPKLLESKDFADFTLKTRSNKFLMAHKNILASRSKVFHAMLTNEMTESSKNEVEILDFEPEVVEGMLEYIYTGEVKSLPALASELHRISDKYDLQGLQKDCEDTLANDLKVENAAQMLTLAHLHNANGLKSKAIVFINGNKLEVRKTESFKSLKITNPELLEELYLSI